MRQRSRGGDEQRGDEHHHHERAVEVLAQDAVGEADAGEDQADLAAGQHAEPDHEPVADAPIRPRPATTLPIDSDHDAQHGDEREELRVGERVEVGVDADLAGRRPG